MSYSEEELAGLTDEEREALQEDEDQEAGADEDGDEADDDGQDEGEGEGEGQGEGGEDEGVQGAGADDQGGDAEEDPQPEVPAVAPILVANAPENAEARLKEIGDEKAALRKAYDDGDITFDEYESKKDALDDERAEIRLALKEAETATKIEQQRLVNEREAQINGFLAEHNIKRDFSDLRFAVLDNAVKLVASREENANLGVREILQKAFDECVSQGVLAPKKAKANDKPASSPTQRKPIKAPPTLAHVPAADMTGTDEGNRFAYLDRLDPVAREAAVAKLSPADLDAYLRTA